MVAIDPAIETFNMFATMQPLTAAIRDSKQLIIIICDKCFVKRYAVAGGIIINATTKIAPAHSKAPTIVKQVMVMSP